MNLQRTWRNLQRMLLRGKNQFPKVIHCTISIYRVPKMAEFWKWGTAWQLPGIKGMGQEGGNVVRKGQWEGSLQCGKGMYSILNLLRPRFWL